MRKPKLSSLLSTTSGLVLVLSTAVIVLVAVAMAAVGPSHSESTTSAAASVKKAVASPSATSTSSADADAKTDLASSKKVLAVAAAAASASPSQRATPDASASLASVVSGLVKSDDGNVSAAVDDSGSSATDYFLKNGWLPRSATNLWEINSIGEVEHDGREYLVAVLSANNETMDDGVDTVQSVAKAAVDGLG